ncbi:MAG: DUF2218 domain-containing protein [Methylovirgula sp.]
MTCDAPAGLRSRAEVETANASRYLQQLCKHFAHKRPVTFDEDAGQIEFTIGSCHLEAAPSVLRISLAAPDAEQLTELQEVVARHLTRFAFREEIRVDWRPA